MFHKIVRHSKGVFIESKRSQLQILLFLLQKAQTVLFTIAAYEDLQLL